ncbi:MAG: hypothetical protein Q7U91_10135 [Sideroxyarcus sp.]|nr:hypothetical protein [Sideroxyarcus sp.]
MAEWMVQRSILVKFLSLYFGVLASGGVLAQTGCGNLNEGYGPFDYRTQKNELKIVEGAHFLPFVENLSRGNTSTTPGGDIDYTLRASPNHHRALMAMMNLARKEKTEKPRGSRYSIACWLDRAERYAPDDAMVKTLYGVHLLQKRQNQDGAKKLEEALVLAGDNANIQYNLGLAYFDLKDYDKSLASAHRAYQLGFPLPGLRNKLEQAGKWREPTPTGTPTAEAGTEPAVMDSEAERPVR